MRAEFEAPLVTLLMGVLLLLAIICANIAKLLYARALSRSREMTVRLAQGARSAGYDPHRLAAIANARDREFAVRVRVRQFGDWELPGRS